MADNNWKGKHRGGNHSLCAFQSWFGHSMISRSQFGTTVSIWLDIPPKYEKWAYELWEPSLYHRKPCNILSKKVKLNMFFYMPSKQSLPVSRQILKANKLKNYCKIYWKVSVVVKTLTHLPIRSTPFAKKSIPIIPALPLLPKPMHSSQHLPAQSSLTTTAHTLHNIAVTLGSAVNNARPCLPSKSS